MPPFPKPRFEYEYELPRELRALRNHRDERNIPAKRDDRLLLATWNIANLGAQDRSTADHELIAEVVSWFDLVAVQEVNDNLSGVRGVLAQLPPSWRMQFSEAGGNRERAARGLELPAHKSAVGGSSLDGHRHYDQVAFFPGETSEFTDRVDVFDFDNAVFADLFAERPLKQFLGYVRYHLSDHRPLWAQFSI